MYRHRAPPRSLTGWDIADTIVALLTDDAVVPDEGRTWRGTAEIRRFTVAGNRIGRLDITP
jgi:hypothetical protein